MGRFWRDFNGVSVSFGCPEMLCFGGQKFVIFVCLFGSEKLTYINKAHWTTSQSSQGGCPAYFYFAKSPRMTASAPKTSAIIFGLSKNHVPNFCEVLISEVIFGGHNYVRGPRGV